MKGAYAGDAEGGRELVKVFRQDGSGVELRCEADGGEYGQRRLDEDFVMAPAASEVGNGIAWCTFVSKVVAISVPMSLCCYIVAEVGLAEE